MKYVTFFILLMASFRVLSTPLPENHFLSPRDFEPLWMTSIERVLNGGKLDRYLKRCDREGISTFNQFLCHQNSSLEKINFSSFNLPKRFQVILIGERHTYHDNQFLLAKTLENLKADEFQYLALEMFNISSQNVLDYYNETGEGLDKVKEVLEEEWNYPSQGYMAMIQAAHEKGLKLLALDDRPSFKGKPFSEGLFGRDQVMASQLNRVLKIDPTARVIAYTGRLHAFRHLGGEIKTISEMVEREHPQVTTSSFMLFAKDKMGTMRSLVLRRFPMFQEGMVVSPGFAPYLNGVILH